jgi:metal-sulfur cluster biosynthetic enzyme
MDAVRRKALTVEGVSRCQVDLVWSPPWDPRRDATEEGKASLGIWD